MERVTHGPQPIHGVGQDETAMTHKGTTPKLLNRDRHQRTHQNAIQQQSLPGCMVKGEINPSAWWGQMMTGSGLPAEMPGKCFPANKASDPQRQANVACTTTAITTGESRWCVTAGPIQTLWIQW